MSALSCTLSFPLLLLREFLFLLSCLPGDIDFLTHPAATDPHATTTYGKIHASLERG